MVLVLGFEHVCESLLIIPRNFLPFFLPLSPLSLIFINLLLTGMGRLKEGELEMSGFPFSYFQTGFVNFDCSGELWSKEGQSRAGSCSDHVS